MDADTICSDESRICTVEDVKKVVGAINFTNIPRAKHLLKSLGNFARQEENRSILEQGGAAKAAAESLTKGKDDPELLSLSSRLIGNMTYDHNENRDVFLALGVIPTLLGIVSNETNRELIRNTTGTLANLASDNENVQQSIVENNGIAILTRLLLSEFPEVLSLALRALNNISENTNTHEKILQTDTLRNLVDLLRSSDGQDEYVRNTFVEILTSLSTNEVVGKSLMEDYKLPNVLWKVLQDWLAKPSWLGEEEEEEVGGDDADKPFPVSVSLLLVHLTKSNEGGHTYLEYFWQEKLPQIFLDQVLAGVSGSDPKTQKGKGEVIHNLGRCIAFSSTHDPAASDLFALLPKVLLMAKADDPTVRMSGILVLGNMATGDDTCETLMQVGACTTIIHGMESSSGDQRIAHVGLCALRSLSISEKNRAQVVNCGGLQIAVQHLSTLNQLIQFEAIGILKCLLLDKILLNNDNIEKFIGLGGVPHLVSLATNPTTEGLTEGEGKDPRVMYESSRLLCRIISNEEVQKSVGSACIKPFATLVSTSFALLQMEGAQAIIAQLSKAENIPAVVSELNTLYTALTNLDPSAPTTPVIATLIWQIFDFVSSKAEVEPEITNKFNDWKVKHPTSIQ